MISSRLRIVGIVAFFVLSMAVIFSLPPIPQDLAYHDFADKRGVWGIPNFGDVMSNVAFMLAGMCGMIAVLKRRGEFLSRGEFRAWVGFFLGSFLVGFGSGYYHWNPSSTTLVWDRLPMTIAFMSLFAAVIMERIDIRAGLYLFPLLLLAGIGSVAYWDYTESLGRGDLRPYALVQFFPMVAIALLLWFFPARYSGTRYFFYLLFWYVLAKLFEHFDGEIFELTHHIVSGHTLKHLAAAMGIGSVVIHIGSRESLSAP